ncbi:16S rRNA (cytosine(967)-C(5))-methyltransferase RsmB [Vampirovibrio chlorellavorus]|uniref:16S rRNA (cytosine(967)-C(5))-methyltransferase RsmB n=1 Tax=Vampirovibrio chlorellavorus TaxID=758823 RepID=UPI0026F2D414|nr:16S rRNA (cytosine(967)-C(5))-methyltransferase RsmB [Vampirovibrio chlorellavorus]
MTENKTEHNSVVKTRDLPRKLALDVLLRFEKAGLEKLKADSLLQQAFGPHPQLIDQERGFCRALVMGTLRRWLVYDAWITQLTGRPLKNVVPMVRCLLRLGLLQLEGGVQVPDYAAIDSVVQLAKGLKQSPNTIRFLNGVLRSAQRRLADQGFECPPLASDLPGHCQARFGWPSSFTESLSAVYTAGQIEAMAQAAQHPAVLSIRVNTLRTSVEAYQQALTAGQIVFEALPDLPEGFLLPEFSGSPRQLPGYDEGWFYVQDAASMWVSRLLNPQPGQQVLDLCAAPGSKTTHMAALMDNQGAIVAVEPKEARIHLLNENLQRLGVTCVTVQQGDGLQLDLADSPRFDAVLVDAPCSGSGTLRRHPEQLLQWKRVDLGALNEIQLALLKQGFAALKPGGRLVYSTCSLLPQENVQLVQRFLAETPEAELAQDSQRLIDKKTDGFYAARFLKK